VSGGQTRFTPFMTAVLAPITGAAGTTASPAPQSPRPRRILSGARGRRALLAAPVVALALAGAGGVPTAASAATTCEGATSTVGDLGTTKAAETVRCLVNVERDAAGLRPLKANARLARAARAHAADMDRRDYFEHVSPGGASFDDRVTARGYRWSTVGENIAAGQTTPRAVVRAWIRSKGHCQNIMSRAYTETGVGAVAGGPSPYGGPTWVQDFARPRGVKAPGGGTVRCSRTPVV
jgi:uncharacterized protein YkwD